MNQRDWIFGDSFRLIFHTVISNPLQSCHSLWLIYVMSVLKKKNHISFYMSLLSVRCRDSSMVRCWWWLWWLRKRGDKNWTRIWKRANPRGSLLLLAELTAGWELAMGTMVCIPNPFMAVHLDKDHLHNTDSKEWIKSLDEHNQNKRYECAEAYFIVSLVLYWSQHLNEGEGAKRV